MTDLETAWTEVHEANAILGWFVGRPAFEERKAVPWAMYAFDPCERPKIGHRGREWTAAALTGADVVREMARCLRAIREGRAPR